MNIKDDMLRSYETGSPTQYSYRGSNVEYQSKIFIVQNYTPGDSTIEVHSIGHEIKLEVNMDLFRMIFVALSEALYSVPPQRPRFLMFHKKAIIEVSKWKDQMVSSF